MDFLKIDSIAKDTLKPDKKVCSTIIIVTSRPGVIFGPGECYIHVKSMYKIDRRGKGRGQKIVY